MKKELYPLKVLYVEDEERVALLVTEFLKRLFKEVYVANNGEDALELFKSSLPDIVITDIQMPKKNGLELSQSIREISKTTPIIVTTAFDDSKYLWDAIKIGINYYIIKPIDGLELKNALIQTAESIIQKREIEEARELKLRAKEQELELLKYKERYHSLQEESAFQKQLKIIRDELNKSVIKNMYVETYYKPLDILSGDSYGTLYISDDLYFFYIIDAMGKGLSASVTSIQSMAFINHTVGIMRKKSNFDFYTLVADYLDFIKSNLIEGEMVCAHFMFLDLKNNKVNFASFGMSPILLHTIDDELFEIYSNNPPIMTIFDGFKVDTFMLDKINKIALFSDGVDESHIDDGNIYATKIKDDFKNACCLKNLLDGFNSVVKNHIDDISIIFIRFDEYKKLTNFSIQSSLKEIQNLINTILYEISLLGFEKGFLEELRSAISEICMNALEHGNLGITYETKKRLVESGEYDEYLKSLLEIDENKQKRIDATIFTNIYDNSIIRVDIEDEGNGFDRAEFFKYVSFDEIVRYSGRGILMAEIMADAIFYNKKGNLVSIIKRKKEFVC